MRHYNPKPLRPEDPNPLFKFCNDYEYETETPLQKQRRQDGTPHTKGALTRLNTGNTQPIDGLELTISKSEKAPIDPDKVVKSFLGIE